jgi:addiction module HigA family antidote
MPTVKQSNSGADLLAAGILPISPAAFLSERILLSKASVDAAAEAMGIPVRVLSDVMSNRQRVTPDIADKLSIATGLSGGFWLNLQSNYDLLKGD